MNFFLVNLQVTTPHQKLHAIILLIDKAKDVSEAVGNDSAQVRVRRHTQHRVSLTTACLSVSENGSIIALDYRLHQGEGTFIVNSLLPGVSVVHLIVGEILGRGA